MTQSPFKPAWWLPGPHLQTLWPTFCRRKLKNLELRRERFELPDGDFLDLDWVGEKGPLVLLLHGLEGSVRSPYAEGMLQALLKKGWRGLFIHFRGCSGEPNRLERGYHSGETQDLAAVVAMVKAREPSTLLAAIGYSLGGNVLLKWLGETGENNPLSAACAVSVPFELAKAAQRFQEGFSRLYQWHLLRCLRKSISRKFQQNGPLNLAAIKTIRDFDEQFTAPLHGFKGADDYYERSSCRQYLAKIKVPTLLLHAQDDPFMTKEVIPKNEELSAQVQLELSLSGGHVGFISGKLPWKSEYWLEQRVPQFLQAYL